jgi:ribosomal protein S2
MRSIELIMKIIADAIAQGKSQQAVQQAQMQRAQAVEPAKD